MVLKCVRRAADDESRQQADDVADSLRRRRALRLAGELDLQPGRRADRAQLIFDRDDAGAWKLEAGAVELHVEERDLPVVGELVGVRERAPDLRDVFRILGQLALARGRGGEHPVDRRRPCGRVEALPARRRHDDAQRSALLPTELGVDQVGRLLRVRPWDLEVVDQLAVERRVQPDEQDEDADPAPDHAPRMARAPACQSREAARMGDPLFLEAQLIDVWTFNGFGHEKSPCSQLSAA